VTNFSLLVKVAKCDYVPEGLDIILNKMLSPYKIQPINQEYFKHYVVNEKEVLKCKKIFTDFNLKYLFHNFEHYMEDHFKYIKDQKTNNFSYRKNPNGKFSYYQIGGR